MNHSITSSSIFLHDIHFHAFHGVFDQERKVGNDSRVDIELFCNFTEASKTDELDNTVSYADIFNIIKEEMSIPSKLLEHVAERIVQHLFDSLPQIEEIHLSLAKRNPPMGADIKEAGIKMVCKRNK